MKKIVITSCDENDDYLNFWNVLKIYWIKMGWYVKFYFIGSKNKYLTLNQDEENVDIIHIKPIENVHTAFTAQFFIQFGCVLEKNEDAIIYYTGFDNILVNDFKLLDNKILKNIKSGQIINSCIDIQSNFNGYSNVKSKNYLSMHFIAKVSTFKNLYFDIIPNEKEFINFIIKNYPKNYTIRGCGWSTDQMVLNKYMKLWEINNTIEKYSMNDLQEGWLYRFDMPRNLTFRFRDSVNGNIINNDIVNYIRKNKHITWFHPPLGHLYGEKNKVIINNKIKQEIIKPLMDYLKINL